MFKPTRPLASAHRWAAAAVIALLSLSAQAHVGADAGSHHGWQAGLVHPFTGLDHLGAMLAVGLWSVRSRSWTAPLAFAAALLGGALLAQLGWTPGGIEPMIAASLLVLGLLLAAQVELPALAGAALIGTFAVFHGAAHGQELGDTAALFGMLAGTVLLHLAGMALGLLLNGPRAWMARAAGAALAVGGTIASYALLAA